MWNVLIPEEITFCAIQYYRYISGETKLHIVCLHELKYVWLIFFTNHKDKLKLLGQPFILRLEGKMKFPSTPADNWF